MWIVWILVGLMGVFIAIMVMLIFEQERNTFRRFFDTIAWLLGGGAIINIVQAVNKNTVNPEFMIVTGCVYMIILMLSVVTIRLLLAFADTPTPRSFRNVVYRFFEHRMLSDQTVTKMKLDTQTAKDSLIRAATELSTIFCKMVFKDESEKVRLGITYYDDKEKNLRYIIKPAAEATPGPFPLTGSICGLAFQLKTIIFWPRDADTTITHEQAKILGQPHAIKYKDFLQDRQEEDIYDQWISIPIPSRVDPIGVINIDTQTGGIDLDFFNKFKNDLDKKPNVFAPIIETYVKLLGILQQ